MHRRTFGQYVLSSVLCETVRGAIVVSHVSNQSATVSGLPALPALPVSRLRSNSRTLDEVVGLQYSYSYSSPAQLGDRKDAFNRDLRAALLQFSTDDRYSE